MRVAHIVPLPKQAVKILNDLHTLTGPEGYVFPQVKDPSRPMSENTLTAALRRMGYTGEQMTWHGFRTTASALLRVRQDWKWRAVSKPRTDGCGYNRHSALGTLRTARHCFFASAAL